MSRRPKTDKPTPAQIAANRANAKTSTGPRTVEGKARSRQNAVQHGMTGAGVVVPPDLATELSTTMADYQRSLAPRDRVERDLSRAAAVGAWRCDINRRREGAELHSRLARAKFEHDRRREDEFRDALHRLADFPADSVRVLTRSVEGLDDVPPVVGSGGGSGVHFDPIQQRPGRQASGPDRARPGRP